MNITILILVILFSFPNFTFAAETYSPGETITIGEFIYNDDYTPTTDDCSVSVYSPSGVALVDNVTMSDTATGWHYYDYLIPGTEGKYPSFISCGSLVGGDLLKLDKTFIVKDLAVDPDIASIKAKTDTIAWADITGIKTNTDTIDWSDVNGIVTTTGDIKTKTDTIDWTDVDSILTSTGSIAWSDISAIKTKTDTITWGDIDTIKTNVATLITEVGTGNISGIKTKTDTIAWTDVTGLITSNGDIKAKTDTIAWADVTAIKTKTDTISWADVTGIKTNTDTIAWTDIDTLGLTASAIQAKTDTINWSDIASLPANIWSYTGRTLTSFGTLVADIWGNTTRTLTGITPNTPWSMQVSDFDSVTASGNYLLTVTTSYNGTLTDSLSLPSVNIYDSNRNIVVNSASMTRTGTGRYSYSYTTSSSAEAGVWETIVSSTVEAGKTLSGNDYWNVNTAPTQVIILGMNKVVIPDIEASVRITNEGSVPYEYQYEWCVVSSIGNVCGGGDDVFYSSAAKLINPGEDFDTNLGATVNSVGDYYFKVVVHYGGDKSGASRYFTATSSSGGGGGGGGGASSPETVNTNICKGADFNKDNKVNSVDFSILLAFWKTNPPFSNGCVDINKDNKVNSVDFSILLSQWGTSGIIFKNN